MPGRSVQNHTRPLPGICARVRSLRQRQGLGQRQLSLLLGLSPNAVNNWEQGRSRPDVELIPNLCRALDTTPYVLLGMEPPAPTPEEALLVDRFRSLSPGHRHALCALAENLMEAETPQEKRKIYALPYYEKPLAAGSGDPTEFYGPEKTICISDKPSRADCIFRVSGDSMEPDFQDGDLVFAQKTDSLQAGEIGAFLVGNELYMKEYRADGLHSRNPAYAPMHFDPESSSVLLLGRILGPVPRESIMDSPMGDHFG